MINLTLFKSYMIVFAVSMLPIVELRGSIPIASALDIPLYYSLPIAVIGNILPVPFIIIFFKYFLAKFRNAPLVGKILTRVHDKAHKEADRIKTYALWGLYVFVAIPLPGTGAWTGSVIASVLEIDNKKSFLVISLGVLTSGVIMALISYLLPDLFQKLFA